MNRAWAYIISKELSAEQIQQIKTEGHEFVNAWTAHENKLSGSFDIFENRIIVVQVNEDVNAASGCSIDKLTRFVKDTEKKYSMELMNRLLVALKINNSLQIFHSSKIKELLQNNTIDENTIVYNTSINNTRDLANWEQPLKETWLNKYLVKN